MEKAKILIVEDEAITAKDIHDRLQDLNYAPAIAHSGEQAIKQADAIKPDLVLMDILLKGMDGIEAAELIRDHFDIPVIYFTAYIDEERLEKTKVTEPFCYIIKPFGDSELRPAIEMALQRHKQEKALRTAEHDWQASFNSLDDVMLIIDRDYTIENINEIGLKLLGKSEAEVIGQKCYQVISGVDSPVEGCPCRKSLETKKAESTDRYEERFGKYYSIKSAPIFDEHGEIIKFVDSRRDITECKRMEEALRKNEERFRALTENTSDWIWEVDENAVYTYSSPKIKELLGYEPEEIIGKTPFDLMTPEDAKRVATEFGVIAEAQKPFDRLENENLHKDGQILVLETSGVPIFDANGNFRGYRGIDRDISERKKREEELKTHREHIKLINKILRHDIINDLNVISSALRLYGRSKKEELLAEASTHVNKSVELINRMRELESFISSHRDLELYSVTDVCKRVLASYPAIAFNIEGEGQVLANESLSSVIDNIIRNAVVHGKTDRIDIKIEGRGEYCEIRIADYGVGIPDEIKEQIFEESFAYGETGGTGLGLCIVKKAMETYGGHVHVEDNTPGGAVFVLRLRKVR
jgi:PAS domain S-box-containing protein